MGDTPPPPPSPPPLPPRACASTAAAAADLDAEKAVAFERARRRFAMYGRRHAHVSHLTQAPATASDATQPPKLKTSLLLQENGELALRLDDLTYRLDGALAASGAAAAAQNVAALTRLLLLEPTQLVLKLAPPSQKLHARLRDVICLLAVNAHHDSVEEREAERRETHALVLAVAVLAFVLTLSSNVDEVFSSDVVDLIVARMSSEAGAADAADAAAVAETERLRAPATADALRRTCLKRKMKAQSRRRSSSGSGEDLLAAGAPSPSSSPGQVNDSRSDQLVSEITRLLEDHDAFCFNGQLVQVSIVDVLAAVLHNLLQMDRGQDERRQVAAASRIQYSNRDLAGVTFSKVLDRKRRLVENHGLDFLVQTLSTRFRHLKQCFLDGKRAASTRDSVHTLWRVQIVLRVLDQASFLAVPVQQLLSAKAGLFSILLGSVDQLSDMSWGVRQSELLSSDSAFAHLVAEVLLVSMRVLINLTHHNEVAARQIQDVQGTSVLFRTFCRLWGFVETAKASTSPLLVDNTTSSPVFEEKLLFDALLMNLSALTNCVEFSEENRRALSTLSAPASAIGDLGVSKTSNLYACELFAHFFLRKVQSYIHLIEMSENRDDHSDGLIDPAHGTHWIPEDVILGGCTSLLLGCLMKNSASNASVVMDILPDGSPRLLLRALSAFVALHSQIGALTPEIGASVLQVEQILKSFDRDLSAFSAVPDMPTSTVPLELKIVVAMESAKQESSMLLSRDISDVTQDSSGVAQKQSEVHTPPAAAFKLQWRKKVCSTVDSDTEEGGDTEAAAAADIMRATKAATPTKRSPKNRSGRSPITRSPRARSPGVRTPSKGTATGKSVSGSSAASPSISSASRGNRDGTPKQAQTQASPPRLKRSRQLVTDLAEKLARVSDDKETTIFASVVSLEGRSSERISQRDNCSDIFDQLDFSKDHTARTSTTTAKTASPAPRMLSRDSSPKTPGARKRARVSRLQAAAQKSPNRRPPLSAALDSAIVHMESQRTKITLEEASSSNSSTVMLLTRSPSFDGALKRKQKVARPLLPHSQQESSHSTNAAAVFDFDA